MSVILILIEFNFEVGVNGALRLGHRYLWIECRQLALSRLAFAVVSVLECAFLGHWKLRWPASASSLWKLTLQKIILLLLILNQNGSGLRASSIWISWCISFLILLEFWIFAALFVFFDIWIRFNYVYQNSFGQILQIQLLPICLLDERFSKFLEIT